MRVVVVEDSKGMRSVVRAMLKSIGATQVFEADHGADAWDLIRSKDVDLVITDWHMPVMNGLDLIAQMRSSANYAALPVILITARTERDEIAPALKAGADGILGKPFSRAQLRAKVDHILGRLPKRRIERVVLGGDRLTRGEIHPLVLLSAAAVTVERLSRPSHEEQLDFLTAATDSLRAINARSPDLHIGYLLESSSSDLSRQLRTCGSRVKMLVLDTSMGDGAVTVARLVSINKADDVSVFLVCGRGSEIPEKVRFGLGRMGVQILERHRLDRDAMEGLYTEYVIAAQRDKDAEVPAQMLTPDEIARRLESDLRSMVDLPVLPQVYRKIVELDHDPDSDLDAWIQAIEAEPLTRAQVVRRARSPLYGFRGEISDARKAIILLGKKPVKEIVVSGAVKQSFQTVAEAGFDLEEYWAHSVAVAIVADILALPLDEAGWTPDQKKQFEECDFQEDALAALRETRLWTTFSLAADEDPFVAGIMHDIGRVALAVGYPGLIEMVVKETADQGWAAPLRAAEASFAGGADHTVAGAILADSWQLGDRIADVIRQHHAPQGGTAFADLTAIADVIAGGIYPFPAGAAFPMSGLFAADGPAVDEALTARLAPFISEQVLPRYGLGIGSLVRLGRAVEPTVRRLVENLRGSV